MCTHSSSVTFIPYFPVLHITASWTFLSTFQFFPSRLLSFAYCFFHCRCTSVFHSFIPFLLLFLLLVAVIPPFFVSQFYKIFNSKLCWAMRHSRWFAAFGAAIRGWISWLFWGYGICSHASFGGHRNCSSWVTWSGAWQCSGCLQRSVDSIGVVEAHQSWSFISPIPNRSMFVVVKNRGMSDGLAIFWLISAATMRIPGP